MIPRKVVQHGLSTLTISLPYRWTDQIGLKKGDTIFMVQKGKDMLLSSQTNNSSNSIEIIFNEKKPFLRRYLLNAYKEGYSEVILKFQDTIPFSNVVKQLEELLGFEIVKQTNKKLIIRDVATIRNDELIPMMKRLFILAREFLKNPNELALEKEINKISNYCLRAIITIEPAKIPKLTSIIDRLEQIGDACKYLDNSKKNKHLIEEIDTYFENLILEFGKDKKDYLMLKTKRVLLMKKLQSKKNKIGNSYLWQIVDNLHHIEISL